VTLDRGPKERKDFLEGLRKNRPVFRQAVDNTILEFEKLLSEYDPLRVISAISKITLTKNPETYAESAEIYSEALVEYLMSLALSKPYPTLSKIPTAATIDRVLRLWKELCIDLELYFFSEPADKTMDQTEAQLRVHLLVSYIFVRGPAYAIHLERMFLELFAPHNPHLLNEIKFSARDLHEFLQRAGKKIDSALNQEIAKSRHLLLGAHAGFNEWVEKRNLQNEPIEDVLKEFREENPDLATDMAEFKDYLESVGSHGVFEIQPNNETDRAILEALSCELGENKAFLTRLPSWRGWPTNDTMISTHPIIKFDGKYYIFHPPMASRSRIAIMEDLLRHYSPQYYSNKYLPSRDKYLEKTSVQLIGTLLPKSQVYSNLHYSIERQGQMTPYELDGLAFYDDCLVIIEAKASRLPPEKRRGSISGFMNSMRKSLKMAEDQATRAIRYIDSARVVSFFDMRGAPIVTTERKQFRHVFIILVNLEPLYQLSSHLPTARKLGLLQGEEWPWFVYLNDLRVISEVVEHPSAFLHYLKRRIALNDQPIVHAFDELDYFMYYVKTGLLFADGDLRQADLLLLTTHTDELDSYYSWLHGERSAVPKPVTAMDPVFQSLISRLETEMPRHFVSVCLHLLDSDDETRSVIARSIEICEKRIDEDRAAKSVALRVGRTGLLLVCTRNINDSEELIARWCGKWLAYVDVDEFSAICWSPPITTGEIRAFLFAEK